MAVTVDVGGRLGARVLECAQRSAGGYVLIRRGGGGWRVSVRRRGEDIVVSGKDLLEVLTRTAEQLA